MFQTVDLRLRYGGPLHVTLPPLLLLFINSNLLVLFVILKNQRMRTRTNFFLANLAVADFCVGIFCVLESVSMFLSQRWFLGRVLCKLYYFVNNMSYTASVMILTVISIERYIAIMHPLKSRRWFSSWKLIVAQTIIWVLAACHNIPYLVAFDLVAVDSGNQTISFCFPNALVLNMKIYISFNFLVWYVFPLIVMTIMYFKIAMVLWYASKGSGIRINHATNHNVRVVVTFDPKKSQLSTAKYSDSTTLKHQPNPEQPVKDIDEDNKVHKEAADKLGDNSPDYLKTQRRLLTSYSLETDSDCISEESDACRAYCDSSRGKQKEKRPFKVHFQRHSTAKSSSSKNTTVHKDSSQKARRQLSEVNNRKTIQSRRKVIRLLIVVVGAFAMCALPYHVQTLIFHWYMTRPPALFTPISFLIFYFNSALNPVLYALLSDNFRRSLKETLCPRTYK